MWNRVRESGRFSRWSFWVGFLLTLGSVGGVEAGGSLVRGVVLSAVGLVLMLAAWATFEEDG